MHSHPHRPCTKCASTDFCRHFTTTVTKIATTPILICHDKPWPERVWEWRKHKPKIIRQYNQPHLTHTTHRPGNIHCICNCLWCIRWQGQWSPPMFITALFAELLTLKLLINHKNMMYLPMLPPRTPPTTYMDFQGYHRTLPPNLTHCLCAESLTMGEFTHSTWTTHSTQQYPPPHCPHLDWWYSWQRTKTHSILLPTMNLLRPVSCTYNFLISTFIRLPSLPPTI